MSAELVVRRAAPDEEKPVISFYEQIILKRTEKDYKLWWDLDVYPTREDLAGAVRDGTIHIVLDEKHIIGAAILNQNQGDGYERIPWACTPEPDRIAVIHLVAVDPDQRGKGVGKKLMDHIISEAEKKRNAIVETADGDIKKYLYTLIVTLQIYKVFFLLKIA